MGYKLEKFRGGGVFRPPLHPLPSGTKKLYLKRGGGDDQNAQYISLPDPDLYVYIFLIFAYLIYIFFNFRIKSDPDLGFSSAEPDPGEKYQDSHHCWPERFFKVNFNPPPPPYILKSGVSKLFAQR